MAEIYLRRLYNCLVPVDQASMDIFDQLKPNGEYKAVITQPRNLGLHRKFFSLLNLAYKNYEQPEVFYDGIRVQKSFERFREEVIIACGYWELELNKRNNVVQKAKSISFASMEQDTFEELFSTAITVIMNEYLTYYTQDDMDLLVNQVLGYA